MKTLRTKCKIVVLTVVMAVLLSGCRIGNTEFILFEPSVDKTTVFTLEERICDVTEYKLYLCNYKNLYGDAYGINLWEYEFSGASLEEYVKDVALAELTRIYCMDILAEEQQLVLSQEEEALVKKAASAYYESLSEEEIDFIGATVQDIEKAYENYALAMKLYHSLMSGEEEEVSDDEARVIRVQQIFVTGKENARVVAQKLADGEEFSTIAAMYNQAANVEVTIARGSYPEVVEQVAFELDDGAVSGEIETDDGFYFIKCLNKFEEVLTEENKVLIRERKEKEEFEEQYQEFTSRAVYQENTEVWQSIVLDASVEYITTDSFFDNYNRYFQRDVEENDNL